MVVLLVKVSNILKYSYFIKNQSYINTTRTKRRLSQREHCLNQAKKQLERF